MSSTRNLANAVGGKTARACDSCIRKRARWYCAADDAFLCQACDSSVHSANSLARRHERVRLTSASCKPPPDSNNSSPSWLGGFTRKARTPRPAKPTLRRPKSDDLISLLSNPSFSPVPETDETTTSHEENEEDQLLYRVPTFDPFFADNQTKVVDAGNLHGFLPTDMDLAEFAADVESLLGRNLESECFDMEGLGLMDCKEEDDMAAAEEDDMARGCSFGGGRVKVEDEEACGQQFDAEIDLMREPFELNFEDYDDAPGSCCEEDEKIIPVMATTVLVGVKNEGGDYADESKTNKKRKVTLRLDWAAVIAAWGSEKSPWTTGERPDFNPDDGWPDCMATCGVNYRHSCGEYGVMGGLLPAAIADGGREARVSRYREKRRTRLFSKKIRYEVRKLNAEKRPRMKGRFVKRTPFAQPPPLPMLSIK